MNTILTVERLSRLNSITKYPSIPTFHALGDKGRLTASVNVCFQGDVHVTEKIDGTNARLVWTREGVIVGSREDFLWATGDLIHNPAMGIVDAVRHIASSLQARQFEASMVVVYGEVFGHRVGAAARQYTSQGSVGFRLFDVCCLTGDKLDSLLEQAPEQIASWRENGGQDFLDTSSLAEMARDLNVAQVPEIGIFKASEWPDSLQGGRDFLSRFETSQASLDADVRGRAEGVVARSADRRKIAKLRIEDYDRTLGAR